MTARAYAVLGAAAVCAVGGWIAGYPSLVVPLIAVLVALTAAAVRIRRAVDVEVSLSVDPARLPRGGAAAAIITVRNRGRRSSPPATCSLTGPIGGAPVTVPSVPAGERRTVFVPLDCRRRGVFQLGPLHVTRTDEFGFFSLPALWGTTTRLVVHPAVEPVVAGRRGALRSLDGTVVDTALGSVEFSRLRDYVPGDDRRRVHWRSTARRGRLMVRELTDTLMPSTVVALDTDPASYPDPEIFERAVDVAASILVSAAEAGPVVVRTGGGLRLEVAGGDEGRRRLEDALALVVADGASLPEFARVLGRRGRGVSLVLVTGAPGGESGAALVALRRAVPSCTVLASANGVDLPPYVVRVPEAGTLAARYTELAP